MKGVSLVYRDEIIERVAKFWTLEAFEQRNASRLMEKRHGPLWKELLPVSQAWYSPGGDLHPPRAALPSWFDGSHVEFIVADRDMYCPMGK